MSTTPPHLVLGLPETATPAQIRRAYRRRAFELHPDRNAAPGAHAAFLAVQDAYAALTAPPVGEVLDLPTGPETGLTDPDPFGEPSGVDPAEADRVAREAEQAAAEAERRRGRRPAGRSWQRIRIDLERPNGLRARLALRLGRPEAEGAWSPAGQWAVETHWEGLRDLRWDGLIRWDEVVGVRERAGAVDLVLTSLGARRLAQAAPAGTLRALGGSHGGVAYRLPVRDPSALAAVVFSLATG